MKRLAPPYLSSAKRGNTSARTSGSGEVGSDEPVQELLYPPLPLPQTKTLIPPSSNNSLVSLEVPLSSSTSHTLSQRFALHWNECDSRHYAQQSINNHTSDVCVILHTDMYATIEPRLIALLNNGEPSQRSTSNPNANSNSNSNSNFDESRPHSPSASLELPPLQDPNILKANGRPLLLEPDASTRNGNPASNSNPQRGPSLTNLIDEGEKTHNEGNGNQNPERRTTERALGISSPQSLRKILGEDVSVSTGVSNKRPAGDNKDDFVQLPQPPKKQKTVKQVVPPIIIGLFEPPPQAALFPPIASSSFHDRHGRNTLNTTNAPPNVKEKEVAESHKDIPLQEPEEKSEGSQENKGKKTVRARKKWTEEETSTLLLGVNKHGIGSWTDILGDSSFSFNNRSAADLKDRFRTCCPAELRVKKPGSGPGPCKDKNSGPAKSKTGLLSENILINEEELGLPSGDSSIPKKPRAHRKKVEDLAQLGIEGPFKKSLRRERTKFSEEEDREILQGYQLHGPAWSRIQRDPQFHLQSRKPTDLRDRFRNKFPDKWDLGKKSELGKETGSPTIDGHSSAFDRKGKENSDPNLTISVGVSQPQQSSSLSSKKPEPRSINTVLNQIGVQSVVQKPSSSAPSSNREGLRIYEIISPDRESSKGLPLQPQASLFGLRDNFSSLIEAPIIETTETSDTLPFTQSFDWGESTAAPFSGNMGEMDISRILDDAWIDNPTSISSTKEKTSATDLNHVVSGHGDAPSGSTSYFNLICDPEEQIVDLQDEAPFG